MEYEIKPSKRSITIHKLYKFLWWSFMRKTGREKSESKTGAHLARQNRNCQLYTYTNYSNGTESLNMYMRCKYVAFFCCCRWLLVFRLNDSNKCDYVRCMQLFLARRKKEREGRKKIESNALNISHMIGLTVNKW